MNSDRVCLAYAEFANFLNQEAQKDIAPLISSYSCDPLTVTTNKKLTEDEQNVLKASYPSIVFEHKESTTTPVTVPHLAFQ